ncbi:MAG: hypothetical protein GEU90_20410 [Gemmatimonas sp.]|nr:hypothetical protein [Gemmatimonas sp.]
MNDPDRYVLRPGAGLLPGVVKRGVFGEQFERQRGVEADPDHPRSRETHRVAPRTRRDRCASGDQYEIQGEQFSAAVRAGSPVPTPPADAIANMGVRTSSLYF